MTVKNLSALSAEGLLDAYEDAAQAHGEATERGDHKAANKAHDRLVAVYRTLRLKGDAADQRILDLLKSENLWVRTWAAAHALEFAPEKAEPVLREISESQPGFLGLEAEMVLSEWREGTLRFP